MDKATKVAVEKYPIEIYGDVGWRCVDKNEHKRKYFIEGYHQAEKDLALTCEDVAYIVDTFYAVEGSTKEKCEEVLRRFNEYKKLV